jgi:hypothetical protein
MPEKTSEQRVEEALARAERLAALSESDLRSFTLDAKHCIALAAEVHRLWEALEQIIRTPSRDWHLNAKIARSALARSEERE